MNKCVVFISVSLLAGLVACEEVQLMELTPPKDPTLTTESANGCQPLPIERNIVGTWQVVFNNHGSKLEKKTGTLRFNEDRTLTDSNQFYQDYVDVAYGKTKSRTWSVETDLEGTFKEYGQMVWVRLYARESVNGIDSVTRFVQGHYYQIKANECNRIHLVHPDLNKKQDIILTR